ncbi:MAG: HAMP domain-containing histidine kinase [Acidobacteriia bacterium]|nr:HAMP domain-containing histidine kinase [Terriglobia bacterium]
MTRTTKNRLLWIAILVSGITVANYATHPHESYYQFFLQALYFIPLMLSGFWFGLRGAIATSGSITVVYLPFILSHWKEFSPDEFESLIEIVIYNVVAGVLGAMRDREMDRLRLLRNSERLAAMGRALSSLAHDMKTPLVAIGGFTRLVVKKLPHENPDRERLEIVIKETQRLEFMVKEMLDFSVDFRLAPADEDIREIVKESLAVVDEIASEKKVQLVSAADPALPLVKCDAMRIKQMLINLLTNAIDCSPPGAPVTVNAYRDEAGLIVDIVDRGAGIPHEHRHLIFDPFFTTKAHGTGLGLPIVKKIVDAHRGELLILDNADHGLTFRVKLPLSAAREAE